jgi:hypothetical protein
VVIAATACPSALEWSSTAGRKNCVRSETATVNSSRMNEKRAIANASSAANALRSAIVKTEPENV